MATVVEPGRNISSVSRGDDIALGLMSACGDCYYCRMGQEGVCEQFDYNRKVGRLPFSGTGGFSEYLSVKERNIFKFSRSVDPGVGAFSEPLSCVHHSIGLIGEKRYKTAVVIGAGTMGLLHILMLKNRVEQIIVSDPSEQRRATALKLGADAGINPDTQDPVKVVRGMTEGRGADVIIDATPVFSIAQDILDMVAPMGTVIYYSSIYPKEHVQLDPNRIHKSMANITGSANSNTHDFSQAVELLSTQEIDPTPLVSAQFQFEDIKEAFTVSLRHDNYRTVIRFS